MPSRAKLLAWAALTLLVVAVTAPALHDPPFWDSNHYVAQGRHFAEHTFHLGADQHSGVLKPPVFASLVLGAASALDPSPLGVHLAALAFALATLFATRALVRALDGSETTALVAGLLCATAPLLLAQAGLAQSDLPVTAFTTWAWVALLRRRLAGWFVLSALAVLTKESAYFLCAPALALEWWRSGGSVSATARRLLIPAWPGLVLAGWLLALQAITGDAVPKINRDALAAHWLIDSLVHQLVEGGRLPLLALAILALRRRRDPATRATFVAVLALPILFPAPLPRYMLPGLPLLCALAALGLDGLAVRPRALVIAAVVALQLAGWLGPSWHANGGHHLDCNLHYRRLLRTQREAVLAIAAARPRAVAAAFPLYFALGDPPEYGWLPAPLPTVLAADSTPTDELCRSELFVESDQSVPTDVARARIAAWLTPWRSFGEPGFAVRVLRLDCPRAAPPAQRP